MIGQIEGINFDAAKIRAAELIGRSDLIEERGSGGQKMDAVSLMAPPASKASPVLPRAYLAHRLSIEPDQVIMPVTPIAGWSSLEYWDPPSETGGKSRLVGEYPCAVFGTVAPDGRAHAHRIYVQPHGHGKAELDGRDPKKSATRAKGTSSTGCAVIWGDRNRASWLLLAEGIETAAALAFAFQTEIERGDVYVCAGIAEAGVGSFKVWPATRRVTVCADRDEAKSGAGYQAGEKAARKFADRHRNKLEVAIAIPGKPGTKADWLDILLSDGAEAVREAVTMAGLATTAEPEPAPLPPYTLTEVHAVFRRWLGQEYDLDTLNAVLATAAAERLPGDPLWLLVVSGSGNAKTETVQSVAGAGAHITSTIQSEGALLSASSRRERSKDATGGLLRKIGGTGILVIKDVTSILSANREVRGPVLAALREVYDGRWERNVGTDGGRTLTWIGRIGVIGAVTTAWDTAHSVIATMGDRFVLIRSTSQRPHEAGQRAIRNTGA